MTDRTLAGWRIRSEIPLPETLPWSGPAEHPVDVEVVIGDTPDTFEDSLRATPCGSVGRDGRYLFTLFSVADYLVEDGRRITVSPRLDPTSPDVRLFLHTNCLSALGLQRGYLALHGAVVEKDGKALAFIGESGRGKSTLAATLCREGFRLLAEDICLLSFPTSDAAAPLVQPTHPAIRLWDDALDLFGAAPSSLVRSRQGKDKFHLVKPEWFCPTPVPLHALFIILPYSRTGETVVSKLKGTQSVGLFYGHILRPWLARALKLEPAALRLAIQLTQKGRMYSLALPKNLQSLGKAALDVIVPILGNDAP